MAFSRKETKLKALEIKIRRAKNQARSQKPYHKLKHADECRDANRNNYTMLIKRITKECQDNQLRHEKFTEKLHHVG